MTDFTSTYRRTTYPKIAPAANDQTGNTVLVTGSSEGIGFNISAAFAEAHADTVILVSRSQSKLDTAKTDLAQRFPHTKVIARSCDIASISDIQALWSWLAQENLPIDILILNAGATEKPTSTDDMVGNLQFAIGSNIVMTEAFRKHAHPSGRQKALVNISSAGVHCYPGIPGQTMYHVGKAGFAAYVSHEAESIREEEMRIVSLHPGCVLTSAVERTAEGNDQVKQLPIWDDPSLAPHMALWVVGPHASFLHGRFIWANWDVDELFQLRDKITQDPAMLKVGFIGVDAFSFPKLMERCGRTPGPLQDQK